MGRGVKWGLLHPRLSKTLPSAQAPSDLLPQAPSEGLGLRKVPWAEPQERPPCALHIQSLGVG